MLQSVFLTKLLILGILYSTVVKAVVLAKLVILDILPLTPFILALTVPLDETHLDAVRGLI